MAIYSKAEAQTKINLLIDNSSKSVTPALLRQALNYLLDMKQLSTHIEDNGVLLSEVLNAAANANIPAWSAKAWPSGYFVYHTDGLIYKSNTAIVAEDTAPGISTKWDSIDSLKPTPTFSSNLSANEIDWSLDAEIFRKTMTSNSTFTFANPVLNKIISFILQGNFTPTWPAGFKIMSGSYVSSATNYIRIHCVNVDLVTPANNKYYAVFTQEPS